MIFPHIAQITSTDIDDLSTWKPGSLADVYIPLQIEIGNIDEDGTDTFQLVVATLEGLKEHASEDIYSGRHHVIVKEYNWPAINRWIHRLVGKIEGETWEEIANKLSRHMAWEFEEYAHFNTMRVVKTAARFSSNLEYIFAFALACVAQLARYYLVNVRGMTETTWGPTGVLSMVTIFLCGFGLITFMDFSNKNETNRLHYLWVLIASYIMLWAIAQLLGWKF